VNTLTASVVAYCWCVYKHLAKCTCFCFSLEVVQCNAVEYFSISWVWFY